MIHLNHMVVLSEPAFAERTLRDLLCGDAPATDRHACSRGWGIGRRR